MLRIKHLTMTHQQDLKIIIENFSCTIHDGEKVAVIGEEGNGKSAFLKWLNYDMTLHQFLSIQGECVSTFERIAYLPQMLESHYFSKSVQDYFFEKVDIDQLDYTQLYQLGNQMGFDVARLYSEQTMCSLSGGERIKVQLLALLMRQPDLLLLDEPSNDLDVYTVQWLQQFIQQTPITVIFISHDVALLQATATSVIHLERLHHKRQAKMTYAKMPYLEYVTWRQNKFDKQTQVALKRVVNSIFDFIIF